MEEMILYFGRDLERINHAVKVHGFAQTIGRLEGLPPMEQEGLELAAILHDIGIHEAERKYGSAVGPHQEKEGPPIAEGILNRHGADPELISRVLYLIGNHHSYGKIDGRDFQILVEADFIVNIFEDGLSAEAAAQMLRSVFQTEAGKRIALSLYSE